MAQQTSPQSLSLLRVRAWPAIDQAEQFRSWWTEVLRDASRATGVIGIGRDAMEDADGLPYEMLSLKFDDEADLATYRTGLEQRQALAGSALQRPLEFSASIERRSDYAVEVVTADVIAGREADYRLARNHLNELAAQAPGFVSVDTFSPAGSRNEWTTILTFESESALAAWRATADHDRGVTEIHRCATDSARMIPSGFAQWFSVNKGNIAETPMWKQALVVTAVLYAMVSILDMTLGDALGQGWSVDGRFTASGLDLPMPVVVFIGNAVGTVLLTWVLMPWVTRAMRWWLDPGASPRTTWWGTLLILAVYVVEIVLFVVILNVFTV